MTEGETHRMRAAIYARVSSQEQSDGVSLEMQKQRCSDWCNSRGWHIAETYHDVETGRHAQREQLVQLRRRLSDIDALVVWRFDRASRSLADLCALIQECAESSVTFVSVTEGIDLSQPFGRATASILGTVAELESDNIGQRVAAAKRKLVEDGAVPWKLKFGYARGPDNKPVADLTEAAVVHRVFRERGEGRELRHIAADLNADGLLRRGMAWDVQRVCNLLHDETYVGRYHRGRRVKRGREWARIERHAWTVETGLFPTLITAEEWYLVTKPGLRGRRSPTPSLFRGLLFCAECGDTFHIRRRTEEGRPSVAYRCTGRHTRNGCTAPQIAEARVLSLLKTCIARCTREGRGCFVEPIPREEAAKAVTAADEKLRRAQAAYLSGLLDLDQVQAVDTELKAAEARAAQAGAVPAEGAVCKAAVAANREALRLFRIGEVAKANALLRRTIARIELDSKALTLRLVLSAHVRAEVG